MAGEGRTASTRNAKTSGQMESGTGQRVGGSAPGGNAKVSRADDRPSKVSGGVGRNTDADGQKISQSQSASQRGIDAIAPNPSMPAFQMLKDSGNKTSRERSFDEWNRTMGPPLPGSEGKQTYPSPLERGTLGEISRGDKYAGTASKVSKPKNQAQ